MGILNKIFGGINEPKEEKLLTWIPLNTIAQLNYITEKSKTKTQFIFKHSTRCGISRMVMNQFVVIHIGFRHFEIDKVEHDGTYLYSF